MSHVEEGTLHAYLDGELPADEVSALERHLSVCVPCRSALAEARGFLTEADGLVLALDVAVSPTDAPVIPITSAARRPRFTTLAWAASLIAAVGLGYSLRNAPIPVDGAQTSLSEAPAAAPTIMAQPSAPAHTPRQDQPATSIPRNGERPAGGATDRSATSDELQSNAAKTMGEVAGRTMEPETRSVAEPRPASPLPMAGAGTASLRRDASPNLAFIQGVPVDTTLARRSFGPGTTGEPVRITMDEAVNRLGGSIQLIDGLSPQRVEVVAGVDVVGADPSREVIRIYYEEPDLGLVTLDQQRPAPSFAFRPAPSEIAPEAVTTQPSVLDNRTTARRSTSSQVATLYWRADGVWLALTSKLTKEQMGMLQARVK